MSQVSFDIPDDLLLTLREQPKEFAQEVRLLAAIYYFQAKRLSLGQAARLAGINRLDFLDILADRGIPAFDLAVEDAAAEITVAQRDPLSDDRQ